MEARYRLASVIAGTFLLFLSHDVLGQYPHGRRPQSQGRQYRATTQHFEVVAPDPKLCNRVAQEAERFRKELAIEWTGKELPPWRERCPILVELGMHAGGETSFAFIDGGSGKGVPVSWQMKIFGPPDRLLDAVLPHEITHTIFATHFGRPLPRWADEGACTTVEHVSEKQRNHEMLMNFLNATPSRGIPFNRMFVMREYPHDILPLYAQGYSLAKFLIMKKGRRYFLDYVGQGMNAEMQQHPLLAWNQTTKRFYGYQDLSDLQVQWLSWVKAGSQVIPDERIAANNAVPPFSGRQVNPIPSTYARANANVASGSNVGSYYSQQSKGGAARVATNREAFQPIEMPVPKSGAEDPSNESDQDSTDAAKKANPDNGKSGKGFKIPTPTIWR